MRDSRLLVFAILAFLCLIKSSTQTNVSAHYWKCRKGDGIFNTGNVLTTVKTSYHQRCFAACNSDPACKSLNVCPSATLPSQSDCTLLTDVTTWLCGQLYTGLPQNSACYHAEKSNPCGKGRLRPDGTCRCELCFRGTDCQLHVRDCAEVYQLASPAGGYNGQLDCFIQPNGAPSPFIAKCSRWGGTIFLSRVQNASGQHWSGVQWATRNWNGYVNGFGSVDVFNFFIGLENMRLLLSQAHYRLMISHQFQPAIANPCGPAYGSLTVGADSSNYALMYASHTLCNGSTIPGLNGFYNQNTPHSFCTVGRDCGTCAKDKGPGWYYNPGCVGYSPFAPIAKWPYFDKGDLIIADAQWYVERDAGLYSP